MRAAHAALRRGALLAAYLALYLALDWVSLIEPAGALGITPWNPPAGLNFALFLRFGFRFVPAAVAAIVAADMLFRDIALHPVATGTSALAIALGYAAAAWALRGPLAVPPRPETPSALLALIAVALAAAAPIAAAAVAVFAAAGLLAWGEFTAVALRFWVGDAIGIAVLTPFLLLGLAPGWRPFRHHAAETLLQFGAIALGLWVIFGLESTAHFELSYVLFLPLIWIALRAGLRGATWGIVATQLGLVVAVQLKGYDADVMAQFQLLMLAVAATGLFLGAVVDQRRRAERSLRDSEARLQAVVSTAPDAILTLAADGTVLSANEAARALFGTEPEGLGVAALLPDLRLDPQAPAARELEARRADGSALAADVALGRTGSDGRTLYVAVVRDVSARRQAEALQKEHEAELAHAGRLAATGEMAAALAHELNQPLTALIGFVRACQTILAGRLDEPARVRAHALIDRAVGQATRAGEIIRTTREFLKHDHVRLQAITIPALFDAVLTLARAEAAFNGVRLELRAAPGLPPVLVDAIQVEQVILNLVRNGIEAMARAGSARRTIVLSAAPAEDPDAIEIAVADSGPGIAPEIAERLFTPFSTTKDTGMGLGLSISRSIVEAHGGRIWAEPHGPEGGAAIRFTLPADAEGERGG